MTGGENKEEQGLTREEMIEQEKLRKEALLQVIFLIFSRCWDVEIVWLDWERETQEVQEAGRGAGGGEAEDQGQGGLQSIIKILQTNQQVFF